MLVDVTVTVSGAVAPLEPSIVKVHTPAATGVTVNDLGVVLGAVAIVTPPATQLETLYPPVLPDCETVTFRAAAPPTAVNESDDGVMLTRPGALVGELVGFVVGGAVGFVVGVPVGAVVGVLVGTVVGVLVGLPVVGVLVGTVVGVPVGTVVGVPVGTVVGVLVGLPVGAAVGLEVAVAVGAVVGATPIALTAGAGGDDDPPPPQAAKSVAPAPTNTSEKRTVGPFMRRARSVVSDLSKIAGL